MPVIKINLTPVEELENPYWWIPDLSLLLLVLIISLGGVYIYTSRIETEITSQEAEAARLTTETQSLNADVESFNSLNQKISQLESKKDSLKRITESKLVRLLPIILLENIQNLKPGGVWLTSLAFIDKKSDTAAVTPEPANPATQPASPAATRSVAMNAGGNEYPFAIEIAGNAASNIQIAEFMMALKATQNQSYEKSDLRTQLFFSDVLINFSQISTQKGDAKTPDIISFKLQLNSRERIGKDSDNPARFSQFIDEFRQHGQASMN